MICYVATHSDSGRRYVGITSGSLSLRRSTHESHAKQKVDDTFFHEAIRAYGVDGFSWKMVAEGDEEVIRLLENALIHTWQTNFPEDGFNTKGGADWIDRPPLTQRPEDYADLSVNVDVLDMMNDLSAIVGWVERNDPDAERFSDLREMCRRLLKPLDRIDPPNQLYPTTETTDPVMAPPDKRRGP